VLPEDGSLWSETCWSNCKYFLIIPIVSTNYIFVHLLDALMHGTNMKSSEKNLSLLRESNSGSAAGRIKTHTIPIVPILALIFHFSTSKKSMETFGWPTRLSTNLALWKNGGEWYLCIINCLQFKAVSWHNPIIGNSAMTYESKFVRSSLMKRWTKSVHRGISFHKIKGQKKMSANETELCSSFLSIFSSIFLATSQA